MQQEEFAFRVMDILTMNTRMNRRLLTAVLFTIVAAALVAPALAQNAPAGTPPPEDTLGQTNLFVIGAVLLALAAIVVALVLRKKPEAMP